MTVICDDVMIRGSCTSPEHNLLHLSNHRRSRCHRLLRRSFSTHLLKKMGSIGNLVLIHGPLRHLDLTHVQVEKVRRLGSH